MPAKNPQQDYFSDVIEELQDSVNMWKTQNHIEMQKIGLSPDIFSMFDLQETPSTDLDEIISEPEEELSQSKEIRPEASQETIAPQEILPQSENDLLLQVKNEYAASIFFDKTRNVLLKRGVPEEKLPDAIDQIFTKMSLKTIETFKGAMTQTLNEFGLNELDTENYIYWRLNEHTADNIMYLIENGEREMLVAENFVTEALLDIFFKNTESIEGTPEEIHEADVVTSEKIDELLDDINNL